MECKYYSIFQKFYSTVKNYGTVVSSDDFNDVISAIDSTLSELKSIQYVFEHNLKGEPEYDEMKKRLLNFNSAEDVIKQRNVSVHENAFDLELRVVGSVFRIGDKFVDEEKVYFCDEDKTVSYCVNSFFELFKLTTDEVYFGVDIITRKAEKGENFVLALKKVIEHVFSVICWFHDSFHSDCTKCEKVYRKMKEIYFKNVLMKTLDLSFEGIFTFGKVNIPPRVVPLFVGKDGLSIDSSLVKIPLLNNELLGSNAGYRDILRRLVIYNTNFVIKQNMKGNILFSVIKLYDDSFTMELYSPDSPSTVHKTMKRYGESVKRDKSINAVIHVFEVYGYEKDGPISLLGFEQRQQNLTCSFLIGCLVTKELKEAYIRLDESKLYDSRYVYHATKDISYRRFTEADVNSYSYFIRKAFIERVNSKS